MSKYRKRTEELQRRLKDDGIAVALLSDEGSIYYYGKYHSYLYMTFGRPTIMVVPSEGEPTIITPTLESEMCERMSWVANVKPWLDGLNDEWRPALAEALKGRAGGKLGIEHFALPTMVRDVLKTSYPSATLVDVSRHVSDMRMIKDPEEIEVARDTGRVAVAMVTAARETIGEGVPEYEVALAAVNAGTRKAAELAVKYDDDPLMSPTIHFHQIMSSGQRVSMCHHRSTNRVMKKGDPIFLCYCGHAEFRQFKIGFDRMFFIGSLTDQMAHMYEIALKSQKAGLDVIRPGVTAEEVHQAYAEVIRQAGFEYPYRHGRAVGYSYQENPQLKFGDKTVLRPGMIFAMDGGATLPNVFRSQVGDTVLVTQTGAEIITPFPKDLSSAILNQ